MRERLVLYIQVTLGPAHLARVRALDAQAGWRCRGVQLASRERTRRYALAPRDLERCITVAEGIYEDLPHRVRVRTAREMLERERPDAVIIDSPSDPVQWRLSRIARRLGARAFTRWASTSLDERRQPLREWLKGFVYRGLDGYLATGERAMEYMRSFGIPADRIHRCGNPVDVEAIARAREAYVARGAQPRHRSFLFVGRFLPHKNLVALLAAYGQYREEGGRHAMHLVGFGETEEAVRAAAVGLPEVRFHGSLQQEALCDLYLKEGALVLPSFSENWGLVVAEAMQAGMPVLVSSFCGCHPELVDSGRNGLVFDPHRVDAIRDALRHFEALSDAERESWSKRSLELIAGHRPEAWGQRVVAALEARDAD